jgi:hypothetical protein
MQNEENTDEVQVVTQENQADVVGETADETVPVETPQETVEARLARAENEVAKYRRLFEKSQKPATQVKAPQTSPTPNVEETVLLANGMPEELLNELKAVAQVRKTTLLKAQNDPIFVAIKERIEREKKQADASLGASRGAGSVKPQTTFTTPGLTRDEHKRLVAEAR